jgi:RNA polymerase sigma factor (sigma-70 family)
VTSTTSEATDLAQARRVLLDELSRPARLVLSLRYADGLGFDEIAEVLDISPAAVKRLYRQTMAMLEDRLG